MTSPNPDVRHGDRITALAGRARSAHTRKPLTRSCYLDVLHVYPQHDGTVEVYAMELTKRDGTWRTGGPDRTVILTAESYTTPIREGDTVHCGRPGRFATVTTIHLAYEDGHITVDLLFADGVTSTVNLATLTHVSRSTEIAAEPVLRLGQRDAEPMPPAPVRRPAGTISASPPTATASTTSMQPGTPGPSAAKPPTRVARRATRSAGTWPGTTGRDPPTARSCTGTAPSTTSRS